MIKNVIFDIGNVILNFDYKKVIREFTDNVNDQKFIYNNIINSPEWLGYGLIDTGYITRDVAIKIVQDRTNHMNDKLIYDFWMNYNDYAFIDENMISLLKSLKDNNYKIYLLSNINEHTVNFINDNSNLLDIVNGYVFSYKEHQVKPYTSIYNTLLNRYKLNPKECLFIDDNQKNIDTALQLGINAQKVEPDNYENVKYILEGILEVK